MSHLLSIHQQLINFVAVGYRIPLEDASILGRLTFRKSWFWSPFLLTIFLPLESRITTLTPRHFTLYWKSSSRRIRVLRWQSYELNAVSEFPTYGYCSSESQSPLQEVFPILLRSSVPVWQKMASAAKRHFLRTVHLMELVVSLE